MITTKNKSPYNNKFCITTISGRAEQLVRSLEKCPLEFTLQTLVSFDKYNSPEAIGGGDAKRWVRQFCGFEKGKRAMKPIIEVLDDGQLVEDRTTLIKLMEGMTRSLK